MPNYGEEYANETYFKFKTKNEFKFNVVSKKRNVSKSSETVPTLQDKGMEEHPMLLSYVLMGKVFPITQHPTTEFPNYHGARCKGGYDSHYTIVDNQGFPCKLIATENDAVLTPPKADEIVIFNNEQVCYKYYHKYNIIIITLLKILLIL